MECMQNTKFAAVLPLLKVTFRNALPAGLPVHGNNFRFGNFSRGPISAIHRAVFNRREWAHPNPAANRKIF